MTNKMILAVLLAFSPPVHTVKGEAPPSNSTQASNSEQITNTTTRPMPVATALNRKLVLSFDHEISLGASDDPETEGTDQIAAIVKQRWSIVSDGRERIRGMVVVNVDRNDKSTTWFGEDSRAIWWTLGGSLRVYMKGALKELEKGDEAASLRCAQQLLRQARNEIEVVLGGGKLMSHPDRAPLMLTLARRSRTIGKFAMLDGDEATVELTSIQGIETISRIDTDGPSGTNVHWILDGFKIDAGNAVPAFAKHRVVDLKGNVDTYTYLNIETRFVFEPAEFERLISIPKMKIPEMAGVRYVHRFGKDGRAVMEALKDSGSTTELSPQEP